MKIEVTAPGKTILHGEHAVVYGKAAIAITLSLKTHLSLISHEENTVVLSLNNLKLRKEWDLQVLEEFINVHAVGVIPPSEECMKNIVDVFEKTALSNLESESQKMAVITFLYLWIHVSKCYNSGSFPPCIINVDSELSVGAGMGSSASYSVCLSAAILIACGRITPHLLPEDKELVNQWAFEAEKIFHGRPSGIDNSICTYGGALFFENGIIADTLPEVHNISILLVNTNIPRNTKILVAGVKQRQQQYPSVVDPVMEAIHAVSVKCWNLLKNASDTSSFAGQMQVLQELVKMNHHLLNSIGVGHPRLNTICEIAETHHCAAKLTGAGGGGCAIVMLPFGNEENRTVSMCIKQELSALGFNVQDVILGCPGLQVKSE